MSSESVDGKPLVRTSSVEDDDDDDEDSMDSFSTLSDDDFVEFSEWDAKFNQPRAPGEEVPPPPGVYPSRGNNGIGTNTRTNISNTDHRTPNGRRGCKELAVLQRQLLLKRQDKKHARDDKDANDDDNDYDSDEAKIVEHPLAKRLRCVATNPYLPKAESLLSSPSSSSSSSTDHGYELVGISPSVQMSHPRPNCTQHRFAFYDAENPTISWADRTKINIQHCSMCYCYLCEVKADQCPDFHRHCNANDRDSMKSYWKYQRHRTQEEASNRHFRFQCSVHLFRNHRTNSCPWPVEMWEQRSWFNKRFCRDCVCFVCNVPVLECPEWSEHCKYFLFKQKR